MGDTALEIAVEATAARYSQQIRDLRQQLSAVTKRLETAVKALEKIAESGYPNDIFARQALAAIRAPEEKK
jgi:hypothetical protein